MEKQIIMEARFDVNTINGTRLEELLKDDAYYVDVGGFEVKVNGKHIPFDFEATAMSFDKDGTCVFGNFDGLIERIYDVDPCHEDSWKEVGLAKEDITAELLASADKLTEFYLAISCYDDSSVPYSLTVKDMTFTNEKDETFSIRHDVLDDFNKQFLAEQYACFMCKHGDFEFRPSTIELYTEIVDGSMKNKTPYAALNMINFVQNNCYKGGIRGYADFLIDQLVSNSESKDSIYRVSLIDCSEIFEDANPFADLGLAESRYYYSDSLEKCKVTAREYIEENNLKEGTWGGGFVYRGNKYIGRIECDGTFIEGMRNIYIDTTPFILDRELQSNMPLLRKDLEEKQILMQASLDVTAITGEPFKDILKSDSYAVKAEGIEIEASGEKLSFDLDLDDMDFSSDGTLLSGEIDADKDHTAEFIAGADKLNRFIFFILDENDEALPHSLNLRNISFTDEDGKTFSMKPEVLEEYNKKLLSEQYAYFICRHGEFAFDRDTIAAVADVIGKCMDAKSPGGILYMINHLQDSCYGDDIRGNTDFLIDQLIASSECRDCIYRVSLMGSFEIPGMYFYADSLKACQQAVSQYIENNSLGARNWGGGFVYQGNEYIGQISYNGRFWDKSHKYGALDTLKDTPALALEKELQCNLPILRQCLEKEIEGSKGHQNETLDSLIDNAATGENQEIGKEIDRDIER